MKISMSLLADYLSRYRPDCRLENDDLEIRGVRFLYDSRLALSSEYVYIDQTKGYLSDPQYTQSCMIASGRSSLVCHNCNQEELLNDILGAFDYYNTWEQELRDAAAEHMPLPQMLDIAMRVMKQPVAVVELDGNVLALADTTPPSTDPQWRYLAKNRALDHASFSQPFFNDRGQAREDLSDQPEYLHVADMLEVGSVSFYLTADGERLATVMIFVSTQPAIQRCIQLCSVLAPCLLKAGEFQGNASRLRSRTSVLTSLLSGEPVSEEVLEAFRRNIHLNPPWQLVALKSLTIQNYTQRNMLIHSLQNFSTANLALEYDETVLILLRQSDCAALLRELEARMGLGSFLVGISLPLHRLRDLPMGYQQVCFAMEQGTTCGVYACQDFALSYLLKGVRQQSLTSQLLHPALYGLRLYDQDNGTELCETLRVYLRQERNQSETARLLNIHRNTLKYRLERIHDLTALKDDDFMERMYLNLSLLLLDEK